MHAAPFATAALTLPAPLDDAWRGLLARFGWLQRLEAAA